MSKDTKERVELITTNKNNNYATVEIEQENQAWLMGWSAKLGKVQGDVISYGECTLIHGKYLERI